MAVQTVYKDNITKGTPGLIATQRPVEADTKVVEGTADIGFGVVVEQGTGNDGIVKVSSGGSYVGITLRKVTTLAEDGDVYKPKTQVPVLIKGDVWMTTGTAVTANAAATYHNTTGAVGATAAGSSHKAIPNGTWLTAASSGGLAILRLK